MKNRMGAVLSGYFLKKWVSEENPYIWLMPTILLLGVFYLWPIIDVIRISFTNAHLFKRTYNFTFDTIVEAFSTSGFFETVWVTFIFVFVSVVGQLVLGLILAVILRRATDRRLPGTTLIKVAVLISWMIPGVSAGISWNYLLSEASVGFLNNALQSFGYEPIRFLSDNTNALISVCIANIWKGTAFSMIVLYAAVSTLPSNLYAASAVDGARPWQQLIFITVPQMKAIITIVLILITIATLNSLEIILALTGGGPGRATEVMSLFILNTVFSRGDIALGSVFAVVLMLISLALTFAYMRLIELDKE